MKNFLKSIKKFIQLTTFAERIAKRRHPGLVEPFPVYYVQELQLVDNVKMGQKSRFHGRNIKIHFLHSIINVKNGSNRSEKSLICNIWILIK